MTEIEFPGVDNIFTGLPVTIDERWLKAGLAFAFIRYGNQLVDIRHANTVSASNSGTPTTGPLGPRMTYTTGQYSTFSHISDYALTGALTLIVGMNVGSYSNYTHMLSKNGTTPGDNTPFEFRHAYTIGTELQCIRAGASTYTIYSSSGATTAVGRQVNAVRYADGALDGVPRFWQNGAELVSAMVASSTGTVTDNGQPVYIGKRQDTDPQLDGSIEFIFGFNTALDPNEIIELSQWPTRIGVSFPVSFTVGSASGVSGTISYTAGDDTLSASGTTTVTGVFSATAGDDTLAAAGTTTVLGTVAYTNGNDTLVSSGAVGNNVTGTVSITAGSDTLSASGTTTVKATVAILNQNDTLSAAGTVLILGTVSLQNGGDSFAIIGSSGSVSTTFPPCAIYVGGNIAIGTNGQPIVIVFA